MTEKKDLTLPLILIIGLIIILFIATQFRSDDDSNPERPIDMASSHNESVPDNPIVRNDSFDRVITPQSSGRDTGESVSSGEHSVEQAAFTSSLEKIFTMRPVMDTPTGAPMLQLYPAANSAVFYELGFENGDLLAKINDQPLDVDNIDSMISQFFRQEEVRLSVYRESYEVGLTIELSKIPKG